MWDLTKSLKEGGQKQKPEQLQGSSPREASDQVRKPENRIRVPIHEGKREKRTDN